MGLNQGEGLAMQRNLLKLRAVLNLASIQLSVASSISIEVLRKLAEESKST